MKKKIGVHFLVPSVSNQATLAVICPQNLSVKFHYCSIFELFKIVLGSNIVLLQMIAVCYTCIQLLHYYSGISVRLSGGSASAYLADQRPLIWRTVRIRLISASAKLSWGLG